MVSLDFPLDPKKEGDPFWDPLFPTPNLFVALPKSIGRNGRRQLRQTVCLFSALLPSPFEPRAKSPQGPVSEAQRLQQRQASTVEGGEGLDLAAEEGHAHGDVGEKDGEKHLKTAGNGVVGSIRKDHQFSKCSQKLHDWSTVGHAPRIRRVV